MFVLLFKCYTRERWKDENIFLLVAGVGVRRCGERYRTDTEVHMWPGGWRLRWCGLHTPAVWVRAWTKCTLHQLQKQYLVHALDREDKKEGLLQLVTEEFNEYLFQIQSRVMCVWYLWKYPYCCAIVSVQCVVVSTAFSADTVTRPPIAHTADTGLSRWGHATCPTAAAAEIDNYISPLRWPFDTCRDSRVGDSGQIRGILFGGHGGIVFSVWFSGVCNLTFTICLYQVSSVAPGQWGRGGSNEAQQTVTPTWVTTSTLLLQ